MDQCLRFSTKISTIGRSQSRGERHHLSCFLPLLFVSNSDPSRLVERPMVLNFRQILEHFDQFTSPITLVCAGNRRKEQNTVRKSKGFSWGPAGLSTSLFTGPMMADILKQAKPLRRAKYLCMEGADKLASYSLSFTLAIYGRLLTVSCSLTVTTERRSS